MFDADIIREAVDRIEAKLVSLETMAKAYEKLAPTLAAAVRESITYIEGHLDSIKLVGS